MATDLMLSKPLQWTKPLVDILANFDATTLGDMEATTLVDTLAEALAETDTDTHGETLGETLPHAGTDIPFDTLVDVTTKTMVDTLVLR